MKSVSRKITAWLLALLMVFNACPISGWAEDGVAVCVGCGLLSGYPDGCFYPQYKATRAQVAAILERLNRWIAGRGQDN